ncbi:MAG: DUF3656 domain-containing protein [Candidatus Izemoplasmatales bacterium]|nr:DUF3656 domain-containing protein [Candidatus Izemoplasmatales bacterium]
MTPLELMAPAGTKDAFIGAINAGTDSVYLSGKQYGARAFADNFDLSEIKDLVQYAHLRFVKVYVTINTLIYDDEIERLVEYTDQLVKADVDALIVQDLGVLDYLHRRYPRMPLHASTQINAHTAEQVAFLKELGASRVIMARETMVDVIREIKKTIDIEIEVFVHGALCVSYSGNCLFSSFVSERSGNRGECSQSCRLPYALIRDGELISDSAYLLSNKDLMTIERLQDLLAVGVDAIKIEGRMRKADYVIQTVLSYRHALDATANHQKIDLTPEIDKLKRVFNRETTQGFLFNALPSSLNQSFRPNHLGVLVGMVEAFNRGKASVRLTGALAVGDGIRVIGKEDTGMLVSRILTDQGPVDQAQAGQVIVLDFARPVDTGSQVMLTLDHRLVQSLKMFLDPNYKRIPLEGSATLINGQPLQLTIRDEAGGTINAISDCIVMKAKNAPLSRDSLENQLGKLGNTSYVWSLLKIKTDGESFVPIKCLNELRRQALDQMTILRSAPRKEAIIINTPLETAHSPAEAFEMLAKVRTQAQLEACLELGIKTLYVEEGMTVETTLYPGATILKLKRRIDPVLSCITLDSSCVVNELGSIHQWQNAEAKTKKHHLVGGEFLNVTNHLTAALFFRMGLSRVTLSLELSQNRIASLISNYQEKLGKMPNLEQIVYGRTELMISKYCPIAKATGVNRTHCHQCDERSYALRDRLGVDYPLINDGNCQIRVLNSQALCLIDYVPFFQAIGIAKIRLDFTTESREETKAIVNKFQQAICQEPIHLNRQGMTTGRFLN